MNVNFENIEIANVDAGGGLTYPPLARASRS